MNFIDWWTNSNNPTLQPSEYLFSTKHIIMLTIAFSLTILLSILFYKKSDKAKKILLTTLVSILLFFEIASRIVNLIITTDFSATNIFKIIMPMHICSVAVWALIIGFFCKQKDIINFSVVAGLLATIAFLLYPAVGINRVYISFTCLYSITSHVTGFIVANLLIVLGFTNFKLKEIWKMFLAFAIMFTWGVLLDFVILPGEDYMYLRNDPLSLNLGFPYHIVYAIFLAVWISAFYIVSEIVQKRKSRINKE